MIDLQRKQDCCGCWACVQRCPKHCIAMSEDDEGFLYPHVDLDACTRCGLCERVCPVINQDQPREPLHVYAAKNRNDEIRMQSSSGGIFTPLAEAIIAQGGVVFGAKFDGNWNVIHAYTETKEGLADFRGSKYVQSQIGKCYREAEQFLKTGRQVLFSGTPCQIAGLHKFLMHKYDNLLTVDVVCHGVPSPMVWRDYLKFITRPQDDGKNTVSSLNQKPVITGISFRDKNTGWKKFGFVARKSASKADQNSVLLHETLDKNLFMQGFLKNLYLRPSCHACPARCGKSGSDITIGDYWGIARWLPEFDDNKGVGLVMVNTTKGDDIQERSSLDTQETTYQQALASNPCIEKSVGIPKQKRAFEDSYKLNGIKAIAPICKTMRPPFATRCIILLKRIVKRIIGRR